MLNSLLGIFAGLVTALQRWLGLQQQGKDEQAGAAIASARGLEQSAGAVQNAARIDDTVSTAKSDDVDQQLREFTRD